MTGADKGFLLLGSRLGNPERRVLTTAQLRLLAERVRSAEKTEEDRELAPEDIGALGYGPEESRRIYALLSEEELLQQYLIMARQYECVPLS